MTASKIFLTESHSPQSTQEDAKASDWFVVARNVKDSKACKAQPDGKFFLKVIEPGTYTLTVKAVRAGKENVLLREDVGISKDLVLNYDVFLG
ncbi:MAG: hypothetical protein COV34_00260 [Candidatus Zambryskibacteria bacterium CG10_big_fil_rev_8_21_14_0_10_42_12]|uniref:Uncharacterized protein n=1 Tax=Candidatus Zambryskibacteria bacterium CG10_big_fil_rev_8_21_14_0_10_42_12 TaxID=1975115 RepID=A0A2H0QX89_9BACT|nr:MAG: hypothetical protein COV34_00260 [Candidatus Zambryskibacteria bacterium CG10_big_fil_rev_8_21_14_0_10_42_12]